MGFPGKLVIRAIVVFEPSTRVFELIYGPGDSGDGGSGSEADVGFSIRVTVNLQPVKDIPHAVEMASAYRSTYTSGATVG